MSDVFAFLTEQQYPQVKRRAWMDDCTFILVTRENLKQCIDHCLAAPRKRFALDLETSGLDNRVFNGKTNDHIVGVCLCPDGKTGYYIPLAHRVPLGAGDYETHPANIPWTEFEAEFRRLMAAVDAGELVAIFHGGIFDQEFLEWHGGAPFGEWDKPAHWDDTEIEVYLDNPRRRNKRLKVLSKEELGIDQIELKELYPEDHPGNYDFSELDPNRIEVLWYGGGDGICTYRLDEKFLPKVLEPDQFGNHQRTIYKIEKLCVASIRWMQRNRIKIDRKKVLDLIHVAQQEWLDAILEVYKEANQILGRDVMPGHYKYLADHFKPNDPNELLDRQLDTAKKFYVQKYSDPQGHVVTGGKRFPAIYDVNAPQQLGVMFDEMKVPGLRRTEKSGQIKTSKDELERVIEEAGTQFPFMAKIRRFRETSKALSSYLFPMLIDSDASDDTMRIQFRAHKVDTGRFATPSKEKDGDLSAKKNRMPGWPEINLQSMPATYDPKRPACMTRLRECIIARDGKFLVAIDFSGVELRLVTNLSREPKWMDEFFHCSSCGRNFDKGDGPKTPDPPPARCPNCGSDKIGDLHTLTALEVYGQDAQHKAEWKQLRQNAKSTNFALCYGGGGSAVLRAIKSNDKNEGWRIKRQFDATYKQLARWWAQQHAFGRKHLYVRTAFGRKYPVPDITHADGGFRSKAERNAVNGPIQGSSADITKLAMGLVYKECKKRGWLEKCLMTITMHDELVFEIDGDILEEAIEVLKHIMTRNEFILAQKWPVPLTSDVEIGFDWSVPWALNEMRAGEVRFKGNKKFKKPEKAAEAGLVWDQLPTFPDVLAPHFKFKTFAALGIGSWTADPVQYPPPVQATEPPEVAEPAANPLAAVGGLAVPSVLKSGDKLIYRLKSPLTMGTLERLAQTIHYCKGRGTRVLKLEAQDGTPLEGWEPGGVPVEINDTEFLAFAGKEGL